jgi:hypothetical protein
MIMIRSHLHQGIIGLSLLMGLFLKPALAQEPEGQAMIISPRVGDIIDAEERDRFRLFPDIKGFQSAVFLLLPDSTCVVRVITAEDGTEQTRGIRLSKTRWLQVRDMIDHYEAIQAGTYRRTSGSPSLSIPQLGLTPNRLVRVKTREETLTGSLLQVSAYGLVLRSDEQDLAVRTEHIEKLWVHRKRTAEGGVIGGLAGALLGAVVASVLSTKVCDFDPCPASGTMAGLGFGIGGAFGTLVGAGIGASRSAWELRYPEQ